MAFEGKVAWVTGASSGLGLALAKGLAEKGAAVILSGRRVEALRSVAAAITGATLVLPFEATESAALPETVRGAWDWRGGVDLLINNAGVSQRSLARDTSVDVYRQLMEVDFFAPLQLTHLMLPRMIERRSGHIAIVASVAGKIGSPLRSGYCAAKHACVGYFDALRAEVETAYGIAVSVILPGSVRTGIARNALTATGSRYGRSDVNIEGGMSAEAAAETILDGLAARRREIVVAQGLELAGISMRASDPEKLFAFTAAEGARLAALREQEGTDFSPDPSKVNADR